MNLEKFKEILKKENALANEFKSNKAVFSELRAAKKELRAFLKDSGIEYGHGFQECPESLKGPVYVKLIKNGKGYDKIFVDCLGENETIVNSKY